MWSLRRESQQRYCIVSRWDEDPSPSQLSSQSLVGKTSVKRLILQRVYKKCLPMLVRSLPFQVNRWTRLEEISTHRKHRRYRNAVRGSRWKSNFRQMRLCTTSSSVENVKRSFSGWETAGESLSPSTLSWVSTDMIEERKNCDSRFFESLFKPVDVFMLVDTETEAIVILSAYMRLTSRTQPHWVIRAQHGKYYTGRPILMLFWCAEDPWLLRSCRLYPRLRI